MLVIGANGSVHGTAKVLSAEGVVERGSFVESASGMTARLGMAPREEGERWVYLLQTPMGVARLVAERGLNTDEVVWTVAAVRLGALRLVAKALTGDAAAFPAGARVRTQPSGALAIDVELVLKEVDGLAPAGDLDVVGRLRADVEHVRARFGDPTTLPGGAIELETPAGRARITWNGLAGLWMVAGDSIDVMPWAAVALTGSTVCLASGGAEGSGSAAEDAARRLTGAYAAFTLCRRDGEGCGHDLELISQRESMADDLQMALSGPGLAGRLNGLVERWKRAQASADAEDGVEVDYSDPIATVRWLAVLAAAA